MKWFFLIMVTLLFAIGQGWLGAVRTEMQDGFRATWFLISLAAFCILHKLDAMTAERNRND